MDVRCASFVQCCYVTENILTNICTQCVQIMPIITVPKLPNSKPAFLNAIGMANMPVPSELFNRCANAPIVLKNEERKEFPLNCIKYEFN